jgi:hypothetical protein
MSQRKQNVNIEISLNLPIKVRLKSLSNHNGFRQNQIDNAIEEFKERILEELMNKIENEYNQQEFIQSVDYVNYEVTSQLDIN